MRKRHLSSAAYYAKPLRVLRPPCCSRRTPARRRRTTSRPPGAAPRRPRRPRTGGCSSSRTGTRRQTRRRSSDKVLLGHLLSSVHLSLSRIHPKMSSSLRTLASFGPMASRMMSGKPLSSVINLGKSLYIVHYRGLQLLLKGNAWRYRALQCSTDYLISNTGRYRGVIQAIQ